MNNNNCFSAISNEVLYHILRFVPPLYLEYGTTRVNETFKSTSRHILKHKSSSSSHCRPGLRGDSCRKILDDLTYDRGKWIIKRLCKHESTKCVDIMSLLGEFMKSGLFNPKEWLRILYFNKKVVGGKRKNDPLIENTTIVIKTKNKYNFFIYHKRILFRSNNSHSGDYYHDYNVYGKIIYSTNDNMFLKYIKREMKAC
jgi:hypothetical protein